MAAVIDRINHKAKLTPLSECKKLGFEEKSESFIRQQVTKGMGHSQFRAISNGETTYLLKTLDSESLEEILDFQQLDNCFLDTDSNPECSGIEELEDLGSEGVDFVKLLHAAEEDISTQLFRYLLEKAIVPETNLIFDADTNTVYVASEVNAAFTTVIELIEEYHDLDEADKDSFSDGKVDEDDKYVFGRDLQRQFTFELLSRMLIGDNDGLNAGNIGLVRQAGRSYLMQIDINKHKKFTQKEFGALETLFEDFSFSTQNIDEQGKKDFKDLLSKIKEEDISCFIRKHYEQRMGTILSSSLPDGAEAYYKVRVEEHVETVISNLQNAKKAFSPAQRIESPRILTFFPKQMDREAPQRSLKRSMQERNMGTGDEEQPLAKRMRMV